MKMRTLVFGAAFVFGSSVLHAQTTQIQAGINFANISVNSNGGVDRANQLTSFQAGLLHDFAIAANTLAIQSGILYTGKGSKVEEGTAGRSGYYKQTFNPRYLEVPVNLLVKVPLAKSTRFFVGAGPYAAIGIGGDVQTEGTNILGQNYSRESDLKFSNDDPTTFNTEEGAGLGVVRRFDYGLNATAGFEAKSVVLGFNLGYGLAKLQSGTNSGADNNNKHRLASITLGFKF